MVQGAGEGAVEVGGMGPPPPPPPVPLDVGVPEMEGMRSILMREMSAYEFTSTPGAAKWRGEAV